MDGDRFDGCNGHARRGSDIDSPPQRGPCAKGGQPSKAEHGQQAERRIEEIDVAPSVVEVGADDDDGKDGQHEAGGEQADEAQVGVAECVPGTDPQGADQGSRAGEAEQEDHRGRGDGDPDGDVVGRNLRPAHHLALEERSEGVGVSGQDGHGHEELEGVAPEPGGCGVEGQGARGREGEPGVADAPALPVFRRLEQVAGPQGQDCGEQQDAHDAEVGEQAHARAAEDEGAEGVPAEGPVDQVEGDHEHDEEGDVLGVDEGMAVEPGMEEEEE